MKNENIKLIIAGEFYDPIDKYLNQINKLGLKEKVIIINNFLESSKIRDYVCASDLIVQPYTRASQSGITPVAYFYDTPLVVSNINGLKEIIQRDKSGEVFNNSAKELSIAILNTIKNDKQELYISNIRKAKIKYTWLRFIKELEKI